MTSLAPDRSRALPPGLTGEPGAPRAPGPARSRSAWRPPPAALTLGALLTLWLVWYPHSPDLAAQAYRTHLFSLDGFALWDDDWYGGHYLPGYSVLFPPLGALIGLRAVGAIAVLGSTAMFAPLARARFGTRAPASTALFALGAVGDLYIGRLTYALGITFAVGAVLAIVRRRRGLAAVLSLACGATSPVAALFLALAATADLVTYRRPARAIVLGGPAIAVTLVLTVLFSDGGYELFSLSSLLAPLLSTLVLLLLLPARERLLRVGALLYLGLLLVSYVVRSPIGSNAARLGSLLIPALLAGAVGVEDARRALGRTAQRLAIGTRDGRRTRAVSASAARWVLYLAIGAIVLWQLDGPLVQSVQASGDPSTQPSYYRPVIRFLSGAQGGTPMRIEVAFTRSHWDATVLGDRFALARGWERQLDLRYNGLFYRGVLTPATYRRWLLDNAVRYVLLSDAALDPASRSEAALIRAGLPYLDPVFASAHWRVYAVAGATALATGPGRLLTLGGDGFTLGYGAPGATLVRVHYTPFWHVTAGAARVTRGPGGWTTVTATRPGIVAVRAQL